MFNKIPAELQALRQWLLWKLAERDGRMTKVPYQPNGRHADVTSPKTWNTFEVCVRASQTGGFSGIGFVFAKGSASYAGVDLDKCRDPQTGVTERWATQIIKDSVVTPNYLSPKLDGILSSRIAVCLWTAGGTSVWRCIAMGVTSA